MVAGGAILSTFYVLMLLQRIHYFEKEQRINKVCFCLINSEKKHAYLLLFCQFSSFIVSMHMVTALSACVGEW